MEARAFNTRIPYRLAAALLVLLMALLGMALAGPQAKAQALGQTWYLAEGSTKWGFDTQISIQNPNNNLMQALITYMMTDGTNATQVAYLQPSSQTIVMPVSVIGAADFSTMIQVVSGTGNIAVNRIMSWYKPGESPPIIEETSSIGTNSPTRTWFLAEGSTNWGFSTYILVQNPNSAPTNATLTFMIEGASPRAFVRTIPARSRQTFQMSTFIGSKDASCQVSADAPIVVERSMFRGANKAMGHETIGATTPATTSFLAEGSTSWGFTTYVLVQNPNPVTANVKLSLLTSLGRLDGPTAAMPPNSRKTFNLNNFINVGALSKGLDVSTIVSSDQPIIAERAMYWYNNVMKEGGHDTIGMIASHNSFYFPSGDTGVGQPDGHQCWTLVQNPNDVAVDITLNYFPVNGYEPTITRTATVPANSRQTFNMSDTVGTGSYSTMVVSNTPGKNIMAESSVYQGLVTQFISYNNFTITRTAGGCSIGAYSDPTGK
jgi:hypothetical protein